MWRASPTQYIKHRAFNNKDDKHYNVILNDMQTKAQRMSKRKWKRASDALEYGKRFNKRIYRIEALPYSNHMNAGNYKPKWTWKLLWRLLVDKRAGLTQAFKESILILLDVLLIDVSRWQKPMDWAKTKASTKNVRGAWIKAGQAGYADPEFLVNWANAKANGIPRGTYWFFDSRVEPKAQATLWWQLIKNDTGELPHAADLEESYGGSYGGHTNWRIFIEEFQRLSGLSNDRIIIYTGYFYWLANAPINFTLLNWFAQFELWLAWYTSNPANVLIPKPWTLDKLIAWQSGTPVWGYELGAGSAEIDVDWFNGSLTEYNQRFNLGVRPVPGGTMDTWKVLQSLKVRSGPSMDYPQVQGLADGDKVEGVLDAASNWIHISRILRVNGNVFSFDGWCSGYSAYVTKLDPAPPDPAPPPSILPDTLYIATKPDMSDKEEYKKQ